MSRLFRTLLLLNLLAWGWSGCASYRVGTGEDLPFHRLYVEPVTNRANLPQAVGLYSGALRQAFLRDGRVSLVNSPEAAEAVLKITLESYDRVGTSARADDTRLARKFDLDVVALATLLDTRSGKEIFSQREIRATRQIYSTATPENELSRQQQAEYTTQTLLARELADRTAAAVLDTW